MPTGACLQIQYTGAQASCLLVADATGKTLSSLIGAAGAESPDAAFGTAGVLDLTAATVDTLAELAAVIDAYADYTATVLYGDDLATENILSATCQAKGTPGYVLFNQASVLSSTALTTWARAKFMLDLPDTDQTLIEYLINTASEIGEDAAGRRLKARTYTKDLDGPGRRSLILPDYPVNSITSIYEDSARAFGAATEIAAADYALYSAEGIVKRLDSTWSEGDQTIRATYNAGLNPVDSRLQDAVIETVAWNLKRFRAGGIGIRSISAPDGVNTALEFTVPLSALRVFESYRDGRL